MHELHDIACTTSDSVGLDISGVVVLCRGGTAREIEKSSAAFPIRNFHHAKPLLKSFGRNLVAKALAISIMTCRKL